MDRHAPATTDPATEGEAAPPAPPAPPWEPDAEHDAAAPEVARRTALRSWRPSRAAVIALVVGLAVTAVLCLIALRIYDRNERRLLTLRVRELSLVLSATAPSVQTPLASAAELASATGGSAAKFQQFLGPLVGPGRQFTSVSLWRLGEADPKPIAVVGNPPAIASLPERLTLFARHGVPYGVLDVVNLLTAPHPALGLVYSVPSAHGAYAVYDEGALPANRRSRIQSNSAFSDLHYVLYLGRSHDSRNLLLTSDSSLPLHGTTASAVVPFGTSHFTLVVSPRGTLGGTFFRDLPWIIGIIGSLVALAATALIDSLAWGRRRAEVLAGALDRAAAENRRMYMEQRGISHTLQHALLPDELPQVPGVQVGARYVPAPSGGEVGGDWYDVVALGEARMAMIIGDVSGHGLDAATTMALLRHATLAYVAQDPQPASVLSKLSTFVNARPHDYFATVLCAVIDAGTHTVTVASAGHPAPLVVDGAHGSYVDLRASPPIGFPGEWEYNEVTFTAPDRATLVAFTDGLVERRGEVLDVGLDRLREVATSARLPVDELLAKLASALASEQNHDDTALVGIQWQS